MPVRLRITLLFSAIVFLILGIGCIIIYYFSVTSRNHYIATRLKNLSITTGRFLSRAETFNPHLIQKIDSLTAIAFTRKTVQAYDHLNQKIYSFNDDDADTVHVTNEDLDYVRKHGDLYRIVKQKDIVINHYTDAYHDMVIVAAGYDNFGRATLKQLLFILGMSVIIGVFIALISGYIFSRRLLNPIAKIAGDVKEISAQNLTRRIATGESKDEWYELANTVNDLLNRLQESFELQKRFIANAAHELSTPLTAISSQLEVSLQRERSAKEYQKTLESIHQDIQHLGKLTHTLLEFAKAAGNKGGIETRLLRIDELLLDLPSALTRIDPGYTVNLRFQDLPDDPQNLLVYGNEELLFTAIHNIALNACKYSNDHRANIALVANDKQLEITVENQGSFIPESERDKIFQPFYRIGENRTAGGFGLGLSLANRIIKLHRGQITVNSDDKTTGFVVVLPAAKYLKI